MEPVGIADLVAPDEDPKLGFAASAALQFHELGVLLLDRAPWGDLSLPPISDEVSHSDLSP